VDDGIEVFRQGVKRIGFELGKRLAQLPFDPVDRVEKVPSFHLELPATEPPIGAKQVVITKDFVLEIIELAAADEAEVRHVLLTLQRVRPVASTARAEFKSNCSHMPARQRALTETVPAGAKNSPQNAIAWQFRPVPAEARAVSMTESARCFCDTNCQ